MKLNAKENYQLILPFDQYQRYKIITDIINKYRKGNEKFKILEIGAGLEENLKKFLFYDNIYFLDRYSRSKYEKKDNYIIGDIAYINLVEKYDFVISIDTYEHVLPHLRDRYINKLIDLSKISTIIASPFEVFGIKESEILLNEMYKSIHGKEHPWLREHIRYGLPSLSHTLELIRKLKLNYVVIPNGYLARWFEMMSICFLIESKPELSKILKKLFEFYNKNFYVYDNVNPAYRQVIIINKIKKIPDFSNIFLKKFIPDKEFDIKNEILQSFLNNIKDLNKELNLKKLKNIIEKKNSIILNLQNAVSNLQNVVSEKNAIICNKELHIKELEDIVSLKEHKIIELNSTLQSIYNCLGWIMLTKYRNLKEKLFPFGTKRR
jgi:hypothetical protein